MAGRFRNGVAAGLREGHEPFRLLATEAAMAFLRTRSLHLRAAAPACVPALRAALQTYEPSLAGHALLMLQRWVCARACMGRVGEVSICVRGLGVCKGIPEGQSWWGGFCPGDVSSTGTFNACLGDGWPAHARVCV